jgi:hypothetical protein
MYRKKLLYLPLLLILYTALASVNLELQGTWRGVFNDSGASGELFYHFVVNGNSLSGKMENGEQELPFAKGRI